MNNPIAWFNEDKKSTEIINDLLRAVYNYYPVGYLHFSERYAGYLAMQEIVAKKIDFECNDKSSASNKFAADLQSHLPDYHIDNRNHLQFPNYSYVVQISSEDSGSVVHEFSLHIVVSLLCDYYTVAFADTYRIRGISGADAAFGHFVSHHSVFSYSSSIERVSEPTMLVLTEAIKKCFPNKKYVHHALLMEPPLISGVTPFMDSYRFGKECSFWELLFSNDDIRGAVVIK